MFKRLIFLTLLTGCGGPQPQQPPAMSRAQAVKAPFEYKIVKRDETRHTMGPQVVLRLQTTNEVAKAATKDDLRQLWQHLAPELGDGRVFIQLDAGVPGASLWGLVSRINMGNGWETKYQIFETGIDADPYYFVDEIDRTKPNQGAMILTLPVVNKIVERLKLSGWKETYRSEDLIKLEKPAAGLESFYVSLSPEGITLDAWHKDESEIFGAVELVTEEFRLSDEIKRKMQSVIGSPEYFRGNRNGVGLWIWHIRDYDVMYTHDERGPKKSIDSVSIDYHQNE